MCVCVCVCHLLCFLSHNRSENDKSVEIYIYKYVLDLQCKVQMLFCIIICMYFDYFGSLIICRDFLGTDSVVHEHGLT